MSIGKIPAIAFFLLKNVYFSPAVNPSFWILLVLGGVLFFGGNLGKHELVLLLLLIGISNRLIPAISVKSSRSDHTSCSQLARYAQILPVNKRSFFSAYLLSSVIYIVFLTSLCIYTGTVRETPPAVASICPPQTITTTAPSGEPLVIVEGITMVLTTRSAAGPFFFRVPVCYSLLFNMLASDVMIDYHEIPYSVLQRLCPASKTTRSPSEIFSMDAPGTEQSKYYSSLLNNLKAVHFGRLILLSSFICLVFLIDATNRFTGGGSSGFSGSMFKWIDYTCHAMYGLLCLLLMLDVLLPEWAITKISLFIGKYQAPIGTFILLTAIAGTMRIMYTMFSIKNPREA